MNGKARRGPLCRDVAEFAKSLHQWIKEEIRWLGVVVAVNAKGEREVLCSGLHAHAVLTQKGFAALVKKLCEFLRWAGSFAQRIITSGHSRRSLSRGWIISGQLQRRHDCLCSEVNCRPVLCAGRFSYIQRPSINVSAFPFSPARPVRPMRCT